MKILFGIQTEGNGHITQAIAVKQVVEKQNCQILGALAADKKQGFPEYFKDEFDITNHSGFDFVFNKNGKMIIWKTILKNIIKTPKLISSFLKICATIREKKPEAIFNFYEPLVGLSALFFPNIKYVSFGHQYAMVLPFYPKINGFNLQKAFLKIINWATSVDAQKIALSYYKFASIKATPCPPILRQESYKRSLKKEDFILVYLMNKDLLPDLIKECEKYPQKNVECFTKFKNASEYEKYKSKMPQNLMLKTLNGKLFQERMKVCSAVICSGGFETSSEAIYQKKPLLMVPIPNHYEQHANCLDAQSSGYCNVSKRIDFSKIPAFQKRNRLWFHEYTKVLYNLINTL